MFGSKLRSWMENHIVRPRKKGNKNKTGSGGTNFGVLTAQNGYKSGTFTGDSAIGSPARRSEISPIQNHTTSRRGWHSPNQDNVPISPKSDHFPIQHRVAGNGQSNGGGAQYWMNTYAAPLAANGAGQSSNHQQPLQHHALSSPRSISRNGSSYTLEPGPPVNVYYSKSVDSFADGGPMPEFDFHQPQVSSTTGTGTAGSMTGGSGAISTRATGGHQSLGYSGVHVNGGSSNELLEELHSLDANHHHQHHRIKRLHPAATATRISSSSASSPSSTVVGPAGSQHHANKNFGNNNNNHMLNGALGNYGCTPNGVGHHHHHQALQQHHQQQPGSLSHPQGSMAVTNGGGAEHKHGKLVHHQQQYGGATYYDQQQHQQQPHQQQQKHLQHNGINNNNNPAYSPNGALPDSVTSVNGVECGGGAGGSKATIGTQPPGPTASPAAPLRNRIINGNNNHNNNNNVHLDVASKGGGGASLTATFASKFHKLTQGGARSAPSADAGSKLNHVNNNGSHATPAAGPYHQLQQQINNATAAHLHPPAQPLPPGKAPASPLPSQPPPSSTIAGNGNNHHLHHPAAAAAAAATLGPHQHHHHAHGTHPLGHNTLSSPESAYSTGYSTDGTSPGGCSYTPEYYINIRTGTHYFPKGTTLPGSLHGRGQPAGLDHAEPNGGTKFKCALNRIEEKHVEFCVEAEKHASPTSSTPPTTGSLSSFKPAGTAAGSTGASVLSQPQQPPPPQPPPPSLTPAQPPNAVAMSPIMQKNLGMQHYRSIESPSPRQRCRIRTNPWLTTADGVLASNCLKRTEQDSGSTSSGIKSSSGTDDNKHDHTKPNALSDTDSSSSTEKIVNKRILTPKSLKKACGDIARLDSHRSAPVTIGSNQDSDEDATLNEMMGKFDESYHYEKETDILSCSDSDPTDCPTDIDTGQDAGDECDTDDLLDLDFIDTGSVQEVPDKEIYRHTASCSIHQFPERIPSCKSQRSLRSKRQANETGTGGGGGSRRRKKLVRTRKKPADGSISGATSGAGDASTVGVGRGCRSLGGTPVSLRRNQAHHESEARTPAKSSPLSNRCNSLTFTEVHSLHSRILAISESEKALLRADLEADVKYKQLIHEAESILFSMKSNSSICIKELTAGGLQPPPPPLPPRDSQPAPPPPPPSSKESTGTTTTTIIASPSRRVCNPPANKRVEMLRNCEADLRRELAKTCSQKSAPEAAELNPAEGVIVNKRLEVLRYETCSSGSLSAPNSPKNTRVLLPRKTHLSNFMHHQAFTSDLKVQSANRACPPPPPPPRLVSKSPTISRRRFRSQSPHLNIESDSDSDDDVSRNLDCRSNVSKPQHRTNTGGNKENLGKHAPAGATRSNQPPPPPPRRDIAGKQMNNFRHTIHGPAGATPVSCNGHEDAGQGVNGHGGMHKSPLISFRSVDIGSPVADDSYCPQSEPLKRKIYTCSAAYEKIQRSLDQDPELSKKALLERISLLRRERQSKSPRHEHEASSSPAKTLPYNGRPLAPEVQDGKKLGPVSDADTKQQLIMDTLAEIKRSLEDQSVELNELNDSDN